MKNKTKWVMGIVVVVIVLITIGLIVPSEEVKTTIRELIVPSEEVKPTLTVETPYSRIYTGSGDNVLNIEKNKFVYAFNITGNESGDVFSVQGYDKNGKETAFFIMATEYYSGTTYDPKMDTVMLKITATGEWTVEVMNW